MNDALKFRSAISDDLEKLQELYQHLIPGDERCPPELGKEIFAQLSKFEGSAILVGEINGELVTSCTLIVIPNLTRGGTPYALIENVVTHAGHRGQGLGKMVLELASNRAWEHSCYKVMLMTGSTTNATLAFYESAGFAQTKTGFQQRRIAARVE
jgi:GNAT superfamily N-acetyltransferase